MIQLSAGSSDLDDLNKNSPMSIMERMVKFNESAEGMHDYFEEQIEDQTK